MGLSFRQAEADDLERLIDVHTSAFPDARDRDARSLALAEELLSLPAYFSPDPF